MQLSMVERETIILFNEGEADAEVYTFNEKLKRKLEQAASRHPEIYQLKKADEHGGMTYVFPKKWLDVRFREPISDAESKRRSEAGKRNDMSAVRRMQRQ